MLFSVINHQIYGFNLTEMYLAVILLNYIKPSQCTRRMAWINRVRSIWKILVWFYVQRPAVYHAFFVFYLNPTHVGCSCHLVLLGGFWLSQRGFVTWLFYFYFILIKGLTLLSFGHPFLRPRSHTQFVHRLTGCHHSDMLQSGWARFCPSEMPETASHCVWTLG